jgi:hypothetical protein
MTGSGFAIADTLVHGEGDHRRRQYTNALAENSGAPRAMTSGDGALPKKSGSRGSGPSVQSASILRNCVPSC